MKNIVLPSDSPQDIMGLLGDIRHALHFRAEEEIFRRCLLNPGAHIVEFPRSGGTWVQQMTQALLSANESSSSRRRVIHHHWPYDDRYRPVIYVLRDGRDVVISLYFYHARYILLDTMWKRRVDSYFKNTLGRGYNVDDVKGNLPLFIESLTDHPFGGLLRSRREPAFLSWPQHVDAWIGKPGVHVVRYEDLLTSPSTELEGIRDHLRVPVSDSQIRQIVHAHSFEAQSGRSRGVEDRKSFMRRGIAGEWRDTFTEEAGEAFEAFGGDALRRVGYEADNEWFRRLPPCSRWDGWTADPVRA